MSVDVKANFVGIHLLEDFEQVICRAAAGLLNTDASNVLAGNSHNTLELISLYNNVFSTPLLATPVQQFDPSFSIMLTLHVWNGHVYVLTDDRVGVFCNEEAATAVLSYTWPPLYPENEVIA